MKNLKLHLMEEQEDWSN